MAAEGATDRINVFDEVGSTIGWVDPLSGERTLLVPGRRADFEETVDFWLSAAGLAGGSASCGEYSSVAKRRRTSVTEVRYPDPDVVRSLLIPLVPLA